MTTSSMNTKYKRFLGDFLEPGARINPTKIITQTLTGENINIRKVLDQSNQNQKKGIKIKKSDQLTIPNWAKLSISSTQPNLKPDTNYYIFNK